jgi:hypothetical protein
VVLESEQGSELLLKQLLDPDADVMGKHEVKKGLLLAIEVRADDDLSPRCPLLTVERQSIGNECKHVEEIASRR